MLAAATGARVHAIHVDHGLREGSALEADVVARTAARVGASFASVPVQVEPGPNLEARARRARYGALPADVLTGHTADDQAETILLALLRGSGWQGLGGMTPSPRRPLLDLRRSETRALCEDLGLETVEDPTNADPAHLRNRIRNELLPLLADLGGRDPVPILVRQSELFRQGGEIIAAAAGGIDPADARGLTAAPPILAREAVRSWLWSERGNDHPPDLATVDRVLDVAGLRATATEVGGGWRVERRDQRLRLIPPMP